MPSEAIAKEDSATGVVPEPVSRAPWRIKAVSVLPSYRLAVTFMDGRSGIVDCSTIQSASNPGIYAPLIDPAYFSQVRLDLGVPTWPNGADLDPAWLYDSLATKESWSVPF